MSNTQSTDGFKEGDLLPGPRVPDPPLSRPPSPPPQPDFELKRLDSSERVVEEESLDVTLTTMDEVPELVEVADESMVDERIAGSEVETPLSRRRKRPLLFEGAMELEVAYKALNMSDTSDTSDEAVTKSLIIALDDLWHSKPRSSEQIRLMGSLYTIGRTTHRPGVVERVLTMEAELALNVSFDWTPIPPSSLSTQLRSQRNLSRYQDLRVSKNADAVYAALEVDKSATNDELQDAIDELQYSASAGAGARQAFITLCLARRNGLAPPDCRDQIYSFLGSYLSAVFEDVDGLIAHALWGVVDDVLDDSRFSGMLRRWVKTPLEQLKEDLKEVEREIKDWRSSIDWSKLRLRHLEGSGSSINETEVQLQEIRQKVQAFKEYIKKFRLTVEKDRVNNLLEVEHSSLVSSGIDELSNQLMDVREHWKEAKKSLKSSKMRLEEMKSRVEDLNRKDSTRSHTLPQTFSTDSLPSNTSTTSSPQSRFVIARLTSQVCQLNERLRAQNVEIADLLLRVSQTTTLDEGGSF